MSGLIGATMLLGLGACDRGPESPLAAAPSATSGSASRTLEASAITYSAPIIITRGGTYSGHWQSLDAGVAAVDIRTTEPVTIVNSTIRSLGNGIRSFHPGAQITIRNVRASALSPTVARARKGLFADIAAFRSLRFEHNEVTGYAAALRLLNYDEFVSRSGQIARVRYNRFKNLDGRMSDGQGSFLLEHQAWGQAIGLNTIRQANVEIAWNEIINLPYQSQTEDVISTYESGGTAAQPIRIHNNYLQGNYAADPAAATDFTGCTINLGDSPSGHPDVGYTDAYNNQVVSFENCGVGLSSGHDQRIWNNRVVSAARAPDGTLLGGTWRNGFALSNFYDSPFWKDNVVRDNVYSVAGRDGQRAPNFVRAGTVLELSNNVELFDRAPTTADEQAEFRLWQRKVTAARVVIGPR